MPPPNRQPSRRPNTRRPAPPRTPTRRGSCNPARALVMDRLTIECERYPDFSLDPLIPHAPQNGSGLSERDAALAHALYDTAVRRAITISRLAGGFLKQPWHGLEPSVQAPLLVGATQFLFFDRVPTHAAIDEAVEWTKHASGKGSSGLVNAVLRRIAGLVSRDADGTPQRRPAWTNSRDQLPLADGRALVLTAPVLPGEELSCAAVATGIPKWQVDRWADEFGADDAIHIAWHTIATGPTILHTPTTPSGIPESSSLAPHDSPAHRVFVGPRAGLAGLLAEHPDVWVQDPTASAAIGLLAPTTRGTGFQPVSPPARIVDLCAGRGTKTRQLLVKYPDAEVIACEVNQDRLEDLHKLAREFPGRVRVCRPEQVAEELAGACDVVVVDVPCSNSGVLARRVEARHRCSQQQVKRLNEQQQEILTLARGLLAPGGRLLYSTCSLEHAENAEMAGWATRALGLTLERELLTLPSGGPGCAPSEYHDGGYAAVLRSSGG
ncbi:MAG: transcription antitermination factor NusB [Planctomycetota bacterium]|nr:transcription antitermination factor NusB [Planctomycetota bacterium]